MTWHPLLGPGLCRILGEERGAGPGPEQRGMKHSSSARPAPALQRHLSGQSRAPQRAPPWVESALGLANPWRGLLGAFCGVAVAADPPREMLKQHLHDALPSLSPAPSFAGVPEPCSIPIPMLPWTYKGSTPVGVQILL